MKRRFMVFGLGVLIAAVAAAVYQASRPQPASRPPVSGEDEISARQKLEGVAEAARSGKGKPVSLSLSEGEINSLIDEALAKRGDDRFKNVVFEMTDGRLSATGDVSLPGLPTGAFSATGDVRVADGELKLDVESVRLGRLPLPGMLRDRVGEVLESELQGLSRSADVHWEDVRLLDNRIDLTGVTR